MHTINVKLCTGRIYSRVTNLLVLGALLTTSMQIAAANNLGCTSGVSGGLTAAAAIGGIWFPPTLVGTAVIGALQIAGIGTDVNRLQNNMDPSCSTIISAPAAVDSVQTATFTSHTYPTFSLPNTSPQDNAYVAAGNAVITAFNQFNTDSNNDAPLSTLYYDVNQEAVAVYQVADLESQMAQGAQLLTQTDFDNAFASIRTNGLPSQEVSFLTSAGWSNSDITQLASYVGGMSFTLTSSPVTVTQLMYALGSTLAPEPNAAIELGAGLLVLEFIRRWQRRTGFGN